MIQPTGNQLRQNTMKTTIELIRVERGFYDCLHDRTLCILSDTENYEVIGKEGENFIVSPGRNAWGESNRGRKVIIRPGDITFPKFVKRKNTASENTASATSNADIQVGDYICIKLGRLRYQSGTVESLPDNNLEVLKFKPRGEDKSFYVPKSSIVAHAPKSN